MGATDFWGVHTAEGQILLLPDTSTHLTQAGYPSRIRSGITSSGKPSLVSPDCLVGLHLPWPHADLPVSSLFTCLFPDNEFLADRDLVLFVFVSLMPCLLPVM